MSWALNKIKGGAGWIKNRIVGGVKWAGNTAKNIAVGTATTAGAVGGGLIGGFLAGLFGGGKQQQAQQTPIEQLPPNVPLSEIPPEKLGMMDKLACMLGAQTVGDLQSRKNIIKYGLLGACLVGGVVLMNKKKAKS